MQVVAKYFNVWDPPPNPAQRMIYLEKDILGTCSFRVFCCPIEYLDAYRVGS